LWRALQGRRPKKSHGSFPKGDACVVGKTASEPSRNDGAPPRASDGVPGQRFRRPTVPKVCGARGSGWLFQNFEACFSRQLVVRLGKRKTFTGFPRQVKKVLGGGPRGEGSSRGQRPQSSGIRVGMIRGRGREQVSRGSGSRGRQQPGARCGSRRSAGRGWIPTRRALRRSPTSPALGPEDDQRKLAGDVDGGVRPRRGGGPMGTDDWVVGDPTEEGFPAPARSRENPGVIFIGPNPGGRS